MAQVGYVCGIIHLPFIQGWPESGEIQAVKKLRICEESLGNTGLVGGLEQFLFFHILGTSG